MDISGSELPNNVGCNCVEGNGQKESIGGHDVQQNSSSKQSGQLEKNKKDFVGMTSVQKREAECLDKKSEEICGNVRKAQQMLQQELNAIEQGFNKLLQQGTENDGLLVLVSKAQVLSNRLQALDTCGQKIEQAINTLSRLDNVPQNQINALRGQLVNTAQQYHALDLQLQCFRGLQELYDVLDSVESTLIKLQKRLSGIFEQPSFRNNELNDLLDEFNDACVLMSYAINAENLIGHELELHPGENYNQINQLQAVAQKRVSVQNQLINIVLAAVERQIAPLFENVDDLRAPARKIAKLTNGNERSVFNSVQKEVDRLREKLNSGQEVTQEELQNLLKQMHKLFSDSVGNSLLDRAVKALTAVAGAGAVVSGAVVSGAAAVGTTRCVTICDTIAGCETACTALFGMGPVGWATVGLGLGATAIGGVIYLSCKK